MHNFENKQAQKNEYKSKRKLKFVINKKNCDGQTMNPDNVYKKYCVNTVVLIMLKI